MKAKLQKDLNNSISNQYRDDFIANIQKNLKDTTQELDDNIFDLINGINENNLDSKDINVNALLKYYVFNQLLENQKQKEEEKNKKFIDTKNPTIKKNEEDNKYYKIFNNEYIHLGNIVEIFEDGSYTKIEKIPHSLFKTKNLYATNHSIISVQLMNPKGVVVDNKWQAAEILGFRKEVAQRFKYSGFSGNSNDFVATVLNKITPPSETGYYMDKTCNFYKWCEIRHSFISQNQTLSHSPLLTDYSFEKSSIVIRKEYTGIN